MKLYPFELEVLQEIWSRRRATASNRVAHALELRGDRLQLSNGALLERPVGISNQRRPIMGRYVDGFVMPLPRKNVEAYRKMAELAGQVWREHGALEYVECIADDVEPGEVTSFPQSVKLEADETVVLAWIVYESREARDRINEAAMNDPRLTGMDPKDMPFDGKRMFWGGFQEFVSA